MLPVYQLTSIDVVSSLICVVILQVLSVSICCVFLHFYFALFWAYLVKKKYFQKISSNNMCCTDVS